MDSYHRHRVPGRSLAQALELSWHCGARPVALLYGPRACLLAVVQGGKARTAQGEVDLGQIYEARVFGAGSELRWNHEGQGIGTAVLLGPAPWDGLSSESIRVLEALETRYYLWGEPVDAAEGWTTLASARIGSLSVPLEVQHGRRVVLRAREYLGEVAGGNVEVVEEQLLELGVD